MINVLINAYAMAPNWGSEQGMGWNWTIQIAKYCKVFVITEGQWCDDIEEALKTLPQASNIKMYYNPVSDKVRKMCWNQGDYRFYYYYDKWQKKTLEIARQIIAENKIDVIHQLNMVGFREPGQLWKIEGIPYVWGCFSGFNPMNLAFMKDMGWKHDVASKLRSWINWYQVRYTPKVRHAFQHANALITTTPYCQKVIKQVYNKDAIIINETGVHGGCVPVEMINRNEDNTFNLLWVGRFIKTKKLDIALKTLANLKKYKNIKLHVVGFGMNSEEGFYKSMACDLGIDNMVVWHGKQPNDIVQQMMRQMKLFFFTSIDEATSTVVPEAIQNRLPIVCHDACAFGALINNSIGRKIPPINPETSITEFSRIIENLYLHQEILNSMTNSFEPVAELLSYENKGKMVYEIYKQLTGKE